VICIEYKTIAEEIWPNFFIVGARKCATTSLYVYLKNIPGVYMSPVKELYYYAPNAVNGEVLDVIRDKEEYLGFFKKANGHIAIGEATPIYLWDPDAPKVIHQTIPHARIVMSLRDPVERAYSQYLMSTKFTNRKSSFYDVLMRDYNNQEKVYGVNGLIVELGMYYDQVKRYFDIFGREQVKVLIFEEWVQDPAKYVNEVLAFLGVNYRVTEIRGHYNPDSSVPRSPLSVWPFVFFRWLRTKNIKFYKILHKVPAVYEAEKILFKPSERPKLDPKADAKAVKFLREIYYDDVLKLQSLLGRSLPWHTVLANNNNGSVEYSDV
jgi:Sulfotransferase family